MSSAQFAGPVTSVRAVLGPEYWRHVVTKNIFDLSSVGYTMRVTVGNTNPEAMLSEEEIAEKNELLNQCLTGVPKGRIMGIEKNFMVLNIGEHNVVLQSLCYHIGFPRKPYWLEETARVRARSSTKASGQSSANDMGEEAFVVDPDEKNPETKTIN